MIESVDAVVIGAGVVGLAVASEIGSKRVYVLEKNESFGRETSSRNSEVVHAGLYYAPGSLKAKLCVEGKEMIYSLAAEHGIPHKRVGKLIVAVNEEEIVSLERIMENASKNGVTDLRLISGNEVTSLEPNVRAVAAIHSHSTGIVDSHLLMCYFLGRMISKGAEIVYNTKVIGVKKTQLGFEVATKGPGEEYFTLSAPIVINCAGLSSDKIAALAGVDIDKAGYRLHFSKGEYFSVARQGLLSRLIYPVPKTDGVLGIHMTLDIDGRLKLGPNEKSLGGNTSDYSVDSSHQQEFYDSARKFLPGLKYTDLQPDMAGIKPKLHQANGRFHDFVVQEESRYGLPGLVNLIGIDSPGLTAAPAIAKYVAQIVAGIR